MGTITEADVRSILALLPPASFTRLYCEHMEKRTEAHLGYQFLAALSLITQTAPQQLSITQGTDLYANELFLLLGASGLARKSTVITMARRLLSDGDCGVDGAFPEAIVPSDIASDEGMQDLIQTKPRCMLAMDEFGNFLQKTVAPQHASRRTLVNQLFDAVPLGRIRVRNKQMQRTEASRNPRVTVLAGCAPEYLMSYTRRVDWNGGFMSRWFIFYPTDSRKLTPPVPDAEEIKVLVKRLQFKARTRVTTRLQCAGRTPLAEGLWNSWIERTRAVTDRLNSETARAVLQRTETHALKIALLLSWDLGEAYLDQWRLSARALVPALRFTNMHVRSIMRIIDEIPANDEAAERAAVLNAIAYEPKTTSRKQVLQAVKISAHKFKGHTTTLWQSGDINVYGADDGSAVSYSRIPRERARADAFDSLDLWDPPAEAVREERGAEDAIASIQAEAVQKAILDDVIADDVEI